MSQVNHVVIYCRYSSDMQRTDSCADQEREVRAGLARLGINANQAVVIRDEAESGTKVNREGFRRLCEMTARGEVAVVGVDTQSRLTRGEDAHAFIKDLVYHGGRFVATAENIDTEQTGWDVSVRVKELQNGLEISGLRHMVRRGQRGRVEADGSAGDFPYGFEAYYLDDDWQVQLARRGPKPKKGVRVLEDEAKWVRRVFAWFVDGRSINWIARELTRQKVPKGHRASTAGWHPQQVRRLLGNEKYIGKWVWGKTTTRRDSKGRKKQVAVPAGQEVIRDRRGLRVVAQDVWDRAAARLRDLADTFGLKAGQRPRGPKPNLADVYPRSPLGGLLTCGTCGARLHQHKTPARRYYACVGAKKGLCGMTTQVPAARAERELSEVVLDLLTGWPEWMREVYRRTCAAVRVAADRVPTERERDTRRAAELEKQVRNLVNALADGGLTSAAVGQRLREAEAEKAVVHARLAASAGLDVAAVAMPDEGWVAGHLSAWAVQAADQTGPKSLVRQALASLTVESVAAPGKKRGYPRLRFRIEAWNALTAALGDALPTPLRPFLGAPPPTGENAPEFVLDLGRPTKLDEWAQRIAEWRAAGVKWKEIVERTGLDLNRVYRAYERYTAATAKESADG